jgi:copper chaperone CopZ
MIQRLRYLGLVVLLAVTGCTTEVVLSVPDMMCEESCAVKVREVLSEQPGVKRVKVDFPNRTATLAVRQSSFNVDRAIAALVDHGFDEARLKTDDPAMKRPVLLPKPPVASPDTSAEDEAPAR